MNQHPSDTSLTIELIPPAFSADFDVNLKSKPHPAPKHSILDELRVELGNWGTALFLLLTILILYQNFIMYLQTFL
jgi:hypothetical protein